ncbi:MAG: hypothetical protein R6X06_05325 [Gammaproteobacteria bacterium]
MADTTSPDISMNPDELYREDVYTDQHIGSLRVLTPVTADGSSDTSRRILYFGQSQMMTPAGALPINFEIDAASLKDAVAQFGAQARQAMEETIDRLKEMQREAASQIVVPGADPGLGGLGGMGGAGGKIRLR